MFRYYFNRGNYLYFDITLKYTETGIKIDTEHVYGDPTRNLHRRSHIESIFLNYVCFVVTSQCSKFTRFQKFIHIRLGAVFRPAAILFLLIRNSKFF